MEWLLVRLRRTHLYRVMMLLRNSEADEHNEARKATDTLASAQHREQAEEDASIRRILTPQYYGGKGMRDESVTRNNAPVQQVKMAVPSGRDLLWGLLLALSIAVNIWCGWEIRDIGTRKWLHDYDLNQFQMGEFRQLQREVDQDHALLSYQCKR